MIETIYSDPNYLQHHGTKGMKWGVRRYQNTDGTRTQLGKRRERTNNAFKPGKDGKPSSAEKITRSSSDIVGTTKKLIRSTNKKSNYDYSTLSDSELRSRINRLKMEQEYSRLTSENVSSGKQKALDILDVVGDIVAISAAAATIGTSIYQIKSHKQGDKS